MASIVDRNAAKEPEKAGMFRRLAVPIAVALVVVGVLAVHADTVRSVVSIWWRSETFAHGFFVVPISVWLAWRVRGSLAAVPAHPAYWVLAFVALGGALWLVATLADALGVQHLALALMLQAAIVTVIGVPMAKAAAFPLLFLLFAVPFGEFLIPTLIEWTADFTVAALRATGVPVYREANHFVIPSGMWSVVEACSGLRYLIASVMIGVLYAHLTFRSTIRRSAFIAASVLVPILANWVRAYVIVMIGHLSNNRLAVGVDHLIYGWLFFGVVMALLFWIGSFWAEPAGLTVSTGPSPRRSEPPASSGPLMLAALAAILVAGLWPPLHALLDERTQYGAPVLSQVPPAAGFVSAPDAPTDWTPSFSGHAAAMRQGFVRDGAHVGLYVAYYRNQVKDHELITSGNQLVLPHEVRWKEVGRQDVDVVFDGRNVRATRASIAGTRETLVAYRLYWVDGVLTGNDYAAKALLAWSKLRGNPGDSALIVTFGPDEAPADVALAALEGLSSGIARILAEASRER